MVIGMVIALVIIIPLGRGVMSWLGKVILPLVILHSAVPWAAIPLSIVLKLVLLGWWTVERSILSKVLVEVSLWPVIPIIISVRAIIPAVWWWSVVRKVLAVWWGSVVSILVPIIIWGAILPVVSVCVVLFSLLWWFSGGGGLFY